MPTGDVRRIGLEDLDRLGIDSKQQLYWDDKPVRTGFDLTGFQTFLAIVVAVATLVGALAAGVQAWTAYHDWACKVQWPAIVACPPERLRIWGE